MDEVVMQAGFKHDLDAAKFAFAFAVNRGCDPAPIEGVGTIWNVGSFDEGGDLRALVQNLFPDTDTPYRAFESLMNSGFALLASEMRDNPGALLEDIIKKEIGASF